jgi:hypothetical protein
VYSFTADGDFERNIAENDSGTVLGLNAEIDVLVSGNGHCSDGFRPRQ